MKRARCTPPAAGALALAAACATQPLAAAERLQGRSQVISLHGIVASEHPRASQAGALVLAEGGTAVDAAIAANAVMGVVAPTTCGLGGDFFALVYEAKTGRLHGLNASGWAPGGLKLETSRTYGFTHMPERGFWSVTISGCVAGWDALHAWFGRKKLARLLAPAIRLADEGFPVSEIVAGYWKSSAALLREDPAAAWTFLPAGHAPEVGEVFRNPDLARSLRQVARGGRRAFYAGAGAQRLLACAQAHAQFVASVADFGFNLQTTLEAPRFTKLTFDGADVEIEARMPEAIRAALAARGHAVKTLPAWADAVGGSQAVMRDFARGINYGASDPRKDGAAVPEPIQ